jgi:citrate synthase
MEHSQLPTDISETMKRFRSDAHPMGIIVSLLAALSSQRQSLELLARPDDPIGRNTAITFLLGLMPALAANSYRHRIGRAQSPANKSLGYIGNFLFMLDQLYEKDYSSHPKLVRAFEILFIIHAEHEVNCSTALLRNLVSSGSNVFSAVSAAAGALYGPRHGGANSSVIRMLE